MFRSKKYLGGMVKDGAQVSGLDNWIDMASSQREGALGGAGWQKKEMSLFLNLNDLPVGHPSGVGQQH